ncbi:MAG: hypothetical protein RL701_5749, partial [Pseudomonadota bacterium]
PPLAIAREAQTIGTAFGVNLLRAPFNRVLHRVRFCKRQDAHPLYESGIVQLCTTG